MEPPGAWLKVVRVEGVGPDVAVPAHDVEWMPVEEVLLVSVADPQGNREFALVVVRLELLRRMNVPLRERGVLEQLAVAVAVAVRRLDLARSVEADPELLLALREFERVGGATRDHHVVALAEGHPPEHRAEHAAPAMYVQHLVALAVAVEAIERLGRLADRDLDVVVEHEQPSPGDRVAARLHRVRVRQPVHVGVRHPLVALYRPELADLIEAAGRVEVEQDRLVAGEALVP